MHHVPGMGSAVLATVSRVWLVSRDSAQPPIRVCQKLRLRTSDVSARSADSARAAQPRRSRSATSR